MTALVWFRRDLRVHDHPALQAASERDEALVPVFCLDDRLLQGRHRSGPRTQFLLECLADLDGALRERGSGLVVRHGPPERELPALARQTGADALHVTADVTPFARSRARRVGPALDEAGVEVHRHPGLTVVDDVASLRTASGKPFTVFSPFHRAWGAAPRRPILDAPSRLPAPPDAGRPPIPALAELGLEQEVSDPLRGGERAARERLAGFLGGPVHDYGAGQDELRRDGTSRLSPYLHFGCVSPREIEERLPAGEGPARFRRQLCWRDFHHQVLLRFPESAHEELQTRYRDTIAWSDDRERFAAWCEGRTGYPLVDAGMRQLRREGWMHNRARLVVGSFLTKHLGIDWRWGERWFMRLLLDGDEANNNGNWQWIASVGTDPQPVWRRIYNPTLQMQRLDPGGTYVRRHVAELRDVPDDWLAEPWTMPPEVQRAAGCAIGEDYPAPIVDHREARRAALERYGAAG
jgi:deoxyribodipyrimidine photo-lyase